MGACRPRLRDEMQANRSKSGKGGEGTGRGKQKCVVGHHKTNTRKKKKCNGGEMLGELGQAQGGVGKQAVGVRKDWGTISWGER